MRNTKGLVPRYFLVRLGADGRRPAWYVMLLAAMASGAVYAAAWLAAITLSWSGEQPFGVMVALVPLTMWGSSTLWYHILYLIWYRRSVTSGPESGTETRYIVWGSLIFMLAIFLFKLLMVTLKYFVAPMIPFIIITKLRNVPMVGVVVANVAWVALVLYPFIALGVRAVGRSRRTG